MPTVRTTRREPHRRPVDRLVPEVPRPREAATLAPPGATGVHTRRPGEAGARLTWVNYGLVFGPALGLVLGYLVAGDDALFLGLSLGAALGVVLGAVVDAARDKRGRHRA